MLKKLFAAGAISIMAINGTVANAAVVSLTNTYALNSALAASNDNYNPQGIGFDSSANELLFVEQSAQNIVRTDLTGQILGTRTLVGGQGNHYVVSVAADANKYYFSDYTCNTGCIDLYSIGKTSGSAVALSTEVAGFGGYPIDVRNGYLYRTNVSNNYDFSNLHNIRISSMSAVDTTLQTLTLSGAGIADFSVDTAHNSIWVLDYLASASVRRFDLGTGALLDTFALGLDGLTAGLTFGNNTLYYYDWNQSGSSLKTYSISGFPAETGTVPEPETYTLVLASLGLLAFVTRRRKAKQVS